MRMTSPAKSVADAFKFRNRLGLETAIDALKQALASRAATPAEIHQIAHLCAVQVSRPGRTDRVWFGQSCPRFEALAVTGCEVI